MSEENDQRIRQEHSELLKEKHAAEVVWHSEVRTTLKNHGESLVIIQQAISEWSKLDVRLALNEQRLKNLEDFKTKSVGYCTGAMTVVLVLWRLIEHFVK